MQELINEALTSAVYLVPLVLVWLIGHFVYDVVNTKFKIKDELTEKDNPSIALSIVGYNIGLVLALGALLTGSSATTMTQDLLAVGGYGLLAVLLLNISALINDRFILPKLSVSSELVSNNKAVGFVEAGSFIANGLILFGALSGDGSILTALAFWGLGQGTLLFGSYVYNWITSFDSKAEIAAGNSAVGVAYAGFLVAVGNIISFASRGTFVSWTENLTNYVFIAAFCFVFLPVIRAILDLVFLRGVSLSKEIHTDKNVGLGAIEASFYLAGALLVGWVMLG